MHRSRERMAHAVWYHVYPFGFLSTPFVDDDPLGPVASDHALRGLLGWLDHLVDLGVGGLLVGPVFASESHGYDTVDPFRIDRRLGDEADLVALAEACHERGLHLLLDGVFNHVGRRHPAYQQVVRERAAAPTADWFHLDLDADGPDGFGYADFEGHDRLVKLNHGNPEVLDWAVEVATYWLDRGIDGWRLDAAYEVPIPFWRSFTERVREVHPEAYLVGEVIRGDFAAFIRQGGLDAVTQYELHKAIWSSLNDRNFYELAHTLDRHGDVVAAGPPWVFLGNHDTTRIHTRLHDWRDLAHAVVLLMLLPGTPAIYAGDEQGADGVKRDEVGGDDAVRRPPPHPPEQLEGDAAGIWRLHRELIAIRRERPWLPRAGIEVVLLENETIVIDVRGDGGALRLALHTGDGVEIPADGTSLAGHPSGELPPHGWAVREFE